MQQSKRGRGVGRKYGREESRSHYSLNPQSSLDMIICIKKQKPQNSDNSRTIVGRSVWSSSLRKRPENIRFNFYPFPPLHKHVLNSPCETSRFSNPMEINSIPRMMQFLNWKSACRESEATCGFDHRLPPGIRDTVRGGGGHFKVHPDAASLVIESSFFDRWNKSMNKSDPVRHPPRI